LEPIPYKKVDEEIIKQYNYLKSLDLSFGWRIHKFWIWFYSLAIAAVVILYVATDSNTLITLKVMSLVMLTLMLLIAIVALTRDFIRKSRHAKKVQVVISSAIGNENEYLIQFNDKTITFITEKVKTEFSWNYWEGYREVNGTLFLFIKGYLYHSTSFSSAEIGSENLESLKTIVKKELPQLEESKLKRWYRLW
jgi:hypothetical protein